MHKYGKITILTHKELKASGKFDYNPNTHYYTPRGLYSGVDGYSIDRYGGMIFKEPFYELTHDAFTGQIIISIEGRYFGYNSWKLYREPVTQTCICDTKLLFDQGCQCGGFKAEQAALQGIKVNLDSVALAEELSSMSYGGIPALQYNETSIERKPFDEILKKGICIYKTPIIGDLE